MLLISVNEQVLLPCGQYYVTRIIGGTVMWIIVTHGLVLRPETGPGNEAKLRYLPGRRLTCGHSLELTVNCGITL